jgi:hypothetical protein
MFKVLILLGKICADAQLQSIKTHCIVFACFKYIDTALIIRPEVLDSALLCRGSET